MGQKGIDLVEVGGYVDQIVAKIEVRRLVCFALGWAELGHRLQGIPQAGFILLEPIENGGDGSGVGDLLAGEDFLDGGQERFVVSRTAWAVCCSAGNCAARWAEWFRA